MAFELSDIFIALRNTCVAMGFIILGDGIVNKEEALKKKKKLKVMLH